jgi:hypothetical protein
MPNGMEYGVRHEWRVICGSYLFVCDPYGVVSGKKKLTAIDRGVTVHRNFGWAFAADTLDLEW